MGNLLTRAEVQARVRISRSRIYVLMRSGEFPLPIRIGRRAVRWDETELEEWLDMRPKAEGRIREAASQ